MTDTHKGDDVGLIDIDRSQFTVVFEGDIGKLPFNPMLKHDTPFGRVVASGFGNAFDEVEALHDALPATDDAALVTPDAAMLRIGLAKHLRQFMVSWDGQSAADDVNEQALAQAAIEYVVAALAARGAGQGEAAGYRVGDFIGRHPVLCVHGHIDQNNLCPACEAGEEVTFPSLGEG